MTPLVAESHARSRRFHADIARRAALVPQHEVYSYSIPNTPFGVPKMLPQAPRVATPNIEPAYWHCMWFYDLIIPRIPGTSNPPKIEQIQRAVARRYGISKLDLLSDRRMQKLVFPRQIAMYLAKVMTGRSLPEIGRRFNGRDHTTALHSIRKIECLIATDEKLAATIAELRAELSA